MYSWTVAFWAAETIGPRKLSSLVGSPIASDDERGDREVDHFVLAGSRHDHAGERRARLAAVEHHADDARRDRLGEVGTVEDHVRRLAAEFLADALHRRRAEFGDAGAGLGRAGDRDHVDVGVHAQCLADGAPGPGDEVEDAGGQSDARG